VKVQKERKRKKVIEEFVQESKTYETYKKFIKQFNFIGKLHIHQKKIHIQKIKERRKKKTDMGLATLPSVLVSISVKTQHCHSFSKTKSNK